MGEWETMTELGSFVIDSVSGFDGVVIGRAEYLYGYVQLLVQPKSLQENGQPTESRWLDEQRFTTESEAKVGGPQKSPPTR